MADGRWARRTDYLLRPARLVLRMSHLTAALIHAAENFLMEQRRSSDMAPARRDGEEGRLDLSNPCR